LNQFFLGKSIKKIIYSLIYLESFIKNELIPNNITIDIKSNNTNIRTLDYNYEIEMKNFCIKKKFNFNDEKIVFESSEIVGNADFDIHKKIDSISFESDEIFNIEVIKDIKFQKKEINTVEEQIIELKGKNEYYVENTIKEKKETEKMFNLIKNGDEIKLENINGLEKVIKSKFAEKKIKKGESNLLQKRFLLIFKYRLENLEIKLINNEDQEVFLKGEFVSFNNENLKYERYYSTKNSSFNIKNKRLLNKNINCTCEDFKKLEKNNKEKYYCKHVNFF
jgi:hypothetical protein